uniref:Uncharacterized protein n=1 Tax=Arundo donax TaxID=35708 RepID=A0A0A8ZZY3_ARUDO
MCFGTVKHGLIQMGHTALQFICMII